MEGRLHQYAPNLTVFEYSSQKRPEVDLRSEQPMCVLLFIGGLGDNFLGVPYVNELAAHLNSSPTGLAFSTVIHVQLSSARTGWGTSSLDRDVKEVSRAIDYIRQHIYPSSAGRPETNVILMGHSTGCQDIMHYLLAPLADPSKPRPPIQGAIIQAPVSDREALRDSISRDVELKEIYHQALNHATSIPEDLKGDVILSIRSTKRLFYDRTPVSVARFESLASPGSPMHPSAEDYFSSDLPDAILHTTFGRIGQSPYLQPRFMSTRSGAVPQALPGILVLISGADEHMPSHVDKHKLLERWKAATRHEGSGVALHHLSAVVEGGNHALTGSEHVATMARNRMLEAVRRYVEGMSEGASEKL